MKPVVARFGRAAGLVAVAAALFFGLRVPESIAGLHQKHQAIRQMQQGNATSEVEVRQLRQRVKLLKGDRAAQELEIKKWLKLQKQNETAIVPER